MSYSLRGIPSHDASQAEFADFMEINCLLDDERKYSVTSANSALGIAYDEADESDDNSIIEALSEIDDRDVRANSNYPFEAAEKSLHLKDDFDENKLEVYKFLLLATRENMKKRKIAANLDGTAIFEQLCAEVLHSYFGPNSKSAVFGTGAASPSPFPERVQSFLDQLDEGNLKFRKPDNYTGHQQDAKVDVTVFIPFPDKNKGQFIAFGQCKTGTSWRTIVSQLRPVAFCKSFINPMPGFTPIAIFLVSESFTENWELTSHETGGLLFDRSRIMSYIPSSLPPTLLQDIKTWNAAVIARE